MAKSTKTKTQLAEEKKIRDFKKFRKELIENLESYDSIFLMVGGPDDSFLRHDIGPENFIGRKMYLILNNKFIYLKDYETARRKVVLCIEDFILRGNENNVFSYINNSNRIIFNRMHVGQNEVSDVSSKIYILKNGKLRYVKDVFIRKVSTGEYDQIQKMLDKPMNTLSIREIQTLKKHNLMPDDEEKNREIESLKRHAEHLEKMTMGRMMPPCMGYGR